MTITLASPDPLEEIREKLAEISRGQGLVRFEIDFGEGRRAELELKDKFKIGPSLIGEVMAIPGVERAEEI
jgi:hypothetical protein